jgi:serine/threonine protein phosphatase PrpC
MKPMGRLVAGSGAVSLKGHRPDNQDFAAVVQMPESENARRGLVAALADGVGGAKAGRMAAELAVRTFIDGYYTQPDTIGISAAADRVMVPYNRWLHAMGKAVSMAHSATTFTAIVAKGRKAHILHVGDSRAWHFRDGRLTCLTQDHCHAHPDQRHILYRALGIEDRLRLDVLEVPLEQHDRLLLTSDGVHGTLSNRQIERLLGKRDSAEADAQAIVDAAFQGGSQDNISAIIVDIVELPAPDYDIIAGEVAKLPILQPPEAGESIDGFRLDELVSDGRYTRLFRAIDTSNSQCVAIKFPKPALLSEAGAHRAFTREILVGARVASPFVAGAIPVSPERQSRLYGVQPFYEGGTLEERMKRAIPLEEALSIAIRLARAVSALHRLDIIHRDIKPDNVILTADGGLKLIDLGVARLPRLDDFSESEIPGTPSYLAPEMFNGNAGDAASDQFALGVTLWRLFVGRYPYGETEAFSRPRFAPIQAPSTYRPELPAWLDVLLLRAVAINPADRFGDLIELLRAVEGGAAVARIPRKRAPLIERNPLRFWQLLSMILAIALIGVLISE